MNGEQINQAARMWNSGFDTWVIASVLYGRPVTAASEAIVCTMLWRGIISTAKSLRPANT